METPRWQRLDAAAAPGGDSSGNASGGGPTPEPPPAAPPPPPVMPPPPPGAPIVAPTEPVAEAKPAEPEPVAQVVQAAAAPVPDSPPPAVAAALPVAELKPAAIAPPSEATGTSTAEASDGPPSTPADAARNSAPPPDGEATPAADDNKAPEAEPPKAEADGDEKPAEPEAAAGDSKPTEPEASGDEAGAPTPATPTPMIAPPVPAVPLGTRIRQYLDHSYTHDGSATAATHAFVISWLVVVSLLLLVIEGAPEFRTFSDGQEVVATETVEPTATPELLVQVRAVVQEEISRSRSLGNAVVELPTDTPQPTAEPTPTPTAEEAAKAAEVTREPWFTMPAEAEGSIHFSFVLLEGIIAVLFTIDYVLNARYEKRWRDYVLGPWGIIDLVAILPFFVVLANYLGLMGEGELPTWVVFLQGLRILRAIKLFRVVSETKTENALGEVVEGSTLHRDILFGCLTVFGAVAILEVFGWTADRNLFWLVLGMASAITVAFRRWCMHSERGGASALVVVASLIIGTALSVAQDRAGDQSVAEWTAVYTVLFVTVSWLQIEAKEGAL
ncbi:MAG: ion transporter [Chloroflexota bacterium]